MFLAEALAIAEKALSYEVQTDLASEGCKQSRLQALAVKARADYIRFTANPNSVPRSDRDMEKMYSVWAPADGSTKAVVGVS